MSEYKIAPFTTELRSHPGKRYYIFKNGSYLHKDGMWRGSTRNPETKEFTGEYSSYEEARLRLLNYLVPLWENGGGI